HVSIAVHQLHARENPRRMSDYFTANLGRSKQSHTWSCALEAFHHVRNRNGAKQIYLGNPHEFRGVPLLQANPTVNLSKPWTVDVQLVCSMVGLQLAI